MRPGDASDAQAPASAKDGDGPDKELFEFDDDNDPPATPILLEPDASMVPPPPSRRSDRAKAKRSDAPPKSSAGASTSPTAAPPADRDDALVNEALAELPKDVREALVAAGKVQTIDASAKMLAPDMVVLLEGQIDVAPAGHACAIDRLSVGVARLLQPAPPAKDGLVLVGGPAGARFLAIRGETLERLNAEPSKLVNELEASRDTTHALAGVLRGALGADIDAKLLADVRRLSETRRLAAGTLVVKAGEKMRALVQVGAGELTSSDSPDASAAISSGEIAFAKELLVQGPAPATLRTGAAGALVLVAKKSATDEWRATPALRALLEGAATKPSSKT